MLGFLELQQLWGKVQMVALVFVEEEEIVVEEVEIVEEVVVQVEMYFRIRAQRRTSESMFLTVVEIRSNFLVEKRLEHFHILPN